jgi:hypothetical protein
MAGVSLVLTKNPNEVCLIRCAKSLGAYSVEKHDPVSDIDTVVVDSLKALDPERPIREADMTRWLFYHPCFATRLGGVSGGKETQGWRDSSHTAMVGAGKFGSAKLPMATATYPGKPSPSQ